MTKSVHKLCTEQGLSLEDLAERTGLELGRIQAIYLRRWTPSFIEREKIAAVFGVTKEDITWGHKTPIQHIYGQGPG